MRVLITLLIAYCMAVSAVAQTPKTYTSSEILLQLKKLDVLGSVLYVAAHPDDENTRLLAYLANGKLYRTGYLSLTRGDGGQNLLGDEQGIELGLIRTQELLAARRIDGAEQFFSRAFDFGFCKNPEEALNTWGHDKILSDVVWVIRKFKPDVIITRFPEDSRAGHGHHSASSILAREAFDAAADSTKFPEQLKEGVTVWQAKRLLWNTYNFGSVNTQRDDQFQMDCGGYNALLGKSYGEIAALSRSQHKSQGFGVPAQRGSVMEYFSATKGDKPVNGLLDGVTTDWSRVNHPEIGATIENIIGHFSEEHPEKSVPALVQLYNTIQKNVSDEYWKEEKLKEIKELIKACSGLFLEATTTVPYAVQGDSLKIAYTINNRLSVTVSNAVVQFKNSQYRFDSIGNDVNASYAQTVFIQPDEKITQPYWLAEPMEKGSFNVSDQQLIGKAENDPVSADFAVTIDGTVFHFDQPVRYKYTDPVRGELYEPLAIVPTLIVTKYSGIVQKKYKKNGDYYIIPEVAFKAYKPVHLRELKYFFTATHDSATWLLNLNSNQETDESPQLVDYPENNNMIKFENDVKKQTTIHYDHIPDINYFSDVTIKILDFKKEFRIVGKTIGYIPGAGDKVPDALEQMGYKVTMLKQADITLNNLKQFDAVVTGVRAYNIYDWLSAAHDTLMEYVKQGGVLLVQYNKDNPIENNKIGPYPFTVVNKRITDETAKVNFLLPDDSALNYPNKITDKDFDGWIQERSIYDVENTDSRYKCILSMKDPGEAEQNGSLITTHYGKGKFVYTSLVFFRELPAGVPGAYRLFANLLANDAL